MQISRDFNQHVYQYFLLPLSQISNKCSRVAADIFQQIKQAAAVIFKKLKTTLWKYLPSSSTSSAPQNFRQPSQLSTTSTIVSRSDLHDQDFTIGEHSLDLEMAVQHIFLRLSGKDLLS